MPMPLTIGTSRALLSSGVSAPLLPPGVVMAIPVTEPSGAPGAIIDGVLVAGSETVGTTGRETVGGVFGATFASAVVGYGDVTMLDGATAATWVLSLRPNNLTQISALLNKRFANSDQNAYAFGVNFGGSRFAFEIGGVGASSFPNTDISTTAYQQIVLLFDGTQAVQANRARMWLNGAELTAIVNTFQQNVAIANTTAPLELGRVNNGALYYSGGIAYAYAWQRALSDAEIAAVWTTLGIGAGARPLQ